ncbi:hypothetical protein [Thiocapsa bogorovii]|uniref:hypothetical protein n=1 Tax=Thiocapsa bogorovii TaxID=521689 RepID=UPI001E3FED52|nr:hypothetical protein [Thiocapsa bogorovii]UHD17390.1 hypothetical protein LT988_04895 [Thiocapsa bogorovii]
MKRPARTGAQRQRELRIKALELLSGDEDAIAAAPVSAILEAIAPAFRKGDPFAVADLVNELLRRMDTPHRFKLTWIDLDRVTVTQQPEPETAPRIVTVTTQSETPPGPKPARGYSPEVRRMALSMADAGISSREIVDAIKAAHGKAPDLSNMAKLLRQWRATLAD